ncbi:uncharacterized protein LAESUDRAFT_761954 [Laetiporus sulphureus 93-53]|uniref:Fungal-type protein kinase domain-containing protein n=1 Tax=Laetiporus sulphureus 93-53 TaxID=1314785 RepID=A0A165CSU3_9APHY|nr:uncharacterized protein LAESUDRAFT_761954 [Laetiporus sulphureus 93-53]KZT03375.1 hypothetical protein LAESUDRAFT_761954 [Laetiporus sulphureus 93-53]
MSFDGMPPSAGVFASIPVHAEESKICTRLVAALNGRGKHRRCSGFTFKNTSARSESPGLGTFKPDVCIFRDGVKDAHQKSKSKSAVAHLAYAELFIEVKRNLLEDFFSDPPENADRASHQFILNRESLVSMEEFRHAKEALGKIVAYATEILARQHRHCLFSMSVSGCYVRLFYWDRSGVVVTEAMSMREHPDIICKFLWWFSHASDYARGFDVTVEWAEPAEEKKFEQAITRHIKEQLLLCTSNEDVIRLAKDEEQVELRKRIPKDTKRLVEALCEHYTSGKVIAVHVFDETTDRQGNVKVEPYRYLVSRPTASPISSLCRDTREYWAVGLDGTVRLLKDSWPYHDSGIEHESTIMKDLTECAVRNAPEVLHRGEVRLCHEDMRSQRTLAGIFLREAWLCIGNTEKGKRRKISVSRHVHCRLVSSVAGYNLRHFTDSKELLESTRDVLDAIADAYNLAKKIHRSVSLNSIILYRKPGEERRRGYLTNWELGCDINPSSERRGRRVIGCWQFASMNVLSINDYQRVVEDDLESLLYTVLFCAVLWLANNGTERQLEMFFANVFDKYRAPYGEHVLGGSAKMMNKWNRRHTKGFVFRSKPLQVWLDEVMDLNSPPFSVSSVSKRYPRTWNFKSLADLWDQVLRMSFPNKPDRVKRHKSDVPWGVVLFVATITPIRRRSAYCRDRPLRSCRIVGATGQREVRGSGTRRTADEMDINREKPTSEAVHEKTLLGKRLASNTTDDKRPMKKTKRGNWSTKAGAGGQHMSTHQRSSAEGGHSDPSASHSSRPRPEPSDSKMET